MTRPTRPSAMTRVAHDLSGLLEASAREPRMGPGPETERKRRLHGPAPCDRQPAHAQGQRSGTKGLPLPPSHVFELGDMRAQVFAAPMGDGRWQAHVTLLRPGSRRRIDRFPLDGGYGTLEQLTVAARAAAELRLRQSLASSDGASCARPT